MLPFWRAVLGYVDRGDSPEGLIDPRARGPLTYFQQMDAPRPAALIAAVGSGRGVDRRTDPWLRSRIFTLFEQVAIESVAYELPPCVVTSAALETRLRAVTDRLRLPASAVEALTGIVERRYFEPGRPVHEAAARAGRRAIAAAGITAADVGLLINTSVSRDFVEPSMASLVHGELGLGPGCANFDLANACLGLLNGIEVAGHLIEAGRIDHALLVDGEDARPVVESTVERLLRPGTTAEDYWSEFATLTLGSAAVAVVLTRTGLSRTTHRVNGAVSIADTAHARLSLGTAERMTTDSPRLLKAGVALAERTWALAERTLPDWSASTIARFACHQIGYAHLAALTETLGIDLARCPVTYPRHGNVGPAGVPLALALADERGVIRTGDHVALMGIGSGLNCMMASVTW